jgi:hypothetical protein
MALPEALTFRLRGCAATAEEGIICDALARSFGDIDSRDVRIRSLATALNPSSETKTATLTFAKLPSAVRSQLKRGEWKLEYDGLGDSLILDSHFLGLTPLNDVKAQNHKYKYVLDRSRLCEISICQEDGNIKKPSSNNNR